MHTNKYFKIFLFFFLFSNYTFSQKTAISGYIEDAITKERLVGAIIEYNQNYNTTNEYGYYSIYTQKNDTISLEVHNLGYKSFKQKLYSNNDTIINFKLQKSDIKIEKIVVNSGKKIHKTTGGKFSLSPEIIKLSPMIGAEVDIMKGLQMLPGVNQAAEGSSDITVRGGSTDQNLIILDDAPIYYLNHVYGFVSIFNADIIKNIDIYKSYFPAKYGGRLSSIMDIRTKDGNMHKFNYKFNLSTITSSIFIEGPILEDKMSFIFSCRRSFLDLFTRPIAYFSPQSNVSAFNFYDINLKFNYKLSNNSKLYISFYNGNDKVLNKFSKNKDNNYSKYFFKKKTGNTISSLSWNSKIFRAGYTNTNLTISNFKYFTGFDAIETKNKDTLEYDSQFSSNIFDISLNNNINLMPLNYLKLNAGFNFIWHNFEPASVFYYEREYATNIIDTSSTINYKSQEYNFFFENELTLGKILIVTSGIRYNFYIIEKQLHNKLLPRLNTNLIINKNLSFKFSYIQTIQTIHLIEFNDYGGKSAIWLPATNNSPAEYAEQYAFSINTTRFKNLILELSCYYKSINNLLAFNNSNVLNSIIDWEQKTAKNGIGKSYGLEFFLNKDKGSLTGWFAYTLSKSTRQFNLINNGNIYPYDYDRPHDIKLFLNYKFKKLNISLFWTFKSGRPISLPVGYYLTIDNVNDFTNYTYNKIDFFTEKNSFRMKPYHRLDISVKYIKEKKNTTITWYFSIYNVYNRLNPYFYYIDTDIVNGKNVKKIYQQSLFPIIPSVGYSLKF